MHLIHMRSSIFGEFQVMRQNCLDWNLSIGHYTEECSVSVRSITENSTILFYISSYPIESTKVSRFKSTNQMWSKRSRLDFVSIIISLISFIWFVSRLTVWDSIKCGEYNPAAQDIFEYQNWWRWCRFDVQLSNLVIFSCVCVIFSFLNAIFLARDDHEIKRNTKNCSFLMRYWGKKIVKENSF